MQYFKSEFYNTGTDLKNSIEQKIKDGWSVYNVFDSENLKGVVVTYLGYEQEKESKILKIRSIDAYTSEFEKWADTIPRDTKIEKLNLYGYWTDKDLQNHLQRR